MLPDLIKFMDQYMDNKGEFIEQDTFGGSGGGTPMKKWESGVSRGPGNQIGNTKWSDSYNITRGKANPLW